MRTLALALAVALTLPGCARLDPAPASVPCGKLTLGVGAPSLVPGDIVDITLTLVNCGTTPLVLKDPDLCGGAQQLAIQLQGPNGTYSWSNASVGGYPAPERTRYGPICPLPGTQPPATLAPGATRVETFAWSGGVLEPRTIRHGDFVIITMEAPVAAPQGLYELSARYQVSEGQTIVAEGTVYVYPPTTPAPHAGFTIWQAPPPPTRAISLPYFDDAPPTSLANETLASRLGLSTFVLDAAERTGDGEWDLRYHISPGSYPPIELPPVHVDGHGWILGDLRGVPDCARVPHECDITLNRTFYGWAEPCGKCYDWQADLEWFERALPDAKPPAWEGTWAYRFRWADEPNGTTGQQESVDANDGAFLARGSWTTPASSP